jgi:predicted DNA-binding transcriptional regulator AlpA
VNETALAMGSVGHPIPTDDDRIISKQEAADWAGVSLRTWERHEAEGSAPPRVQMSARRFGYWKSDVRVWLRKRTASKKAA